MIFHFDLRCMLRCAPPPLSRYRMMSLLRKEDTYDAYHRTTTHFNRCRAQSIAVDAEPVFDAPEDLRG